MALGTLAVHQYRKELLNVRRVDQALELVKGLVMHVSSVGDRLDCPSPLVEGGIRLGMFHQQSEGLETTVHGGEADERFATCLEVRIKVLPLEAFQQHVEELSIVGADGDLRQAVKGRPVACVLLCVASCDHE